MKKALFTVVFASLCQLASARETLPIKGTVVSAADKHIQYQWAHREIFEKNPVH